jgi:hypothetical protein
MPSRSGTGDISTRMSRDVALEDCTQLNKPAKLKKFVHAIQRLLMQAERASIGRHTDGKMARTESGELSGSTLIYVWTTMPCVKRCARCWNPLGTR